MTKTTDTFGQRLLRLREAAGLSGYGLAQKAGITRQYLAELEREQKQPSLEIARKLAQALGHGLAVWE